MGGGGANARDKNTSAGLSAKNAGGGGLCASVGRICGTLRYIIYNIKVPLASLGGSRFTAYLRFFSSNSGTKYCYSTNFGMWTY